MPTSQGPLRKDAPPPVVDSWAPRWLRRAAFVIAALYLSAIWLDAVGTGIPNRVLPLPARFFVQVAQLFPRAADDVIEWRARGFRCAAGHFEELDLTPLFPMHAADKENRFDRAMFFFFEDPHTLASLDRYISGAEAALGPDHRLGGVMLLSLRVPIPPLGHAEAPYRRLPISAYPRALVHRHYWYVTPREDWDRRCQESP